MRFSKGLLVSLTAVGLVGCSSSASGPSSPSPEATVTTRPTAAQTGPVVPHAEAGARAAAARFDGLYLAGHFAASWGLLGPAVKQQVPLGAWIQVHHACQAVGTGTARAIKAITVFGNAAIITEAIATGPAKSRTFEEVFSYANGQWGYSPNDMSIYHHGSAAADIAAARAAGVCATGKTF
jgi:hypothetical protein